MRALPNTLPDYCNDKEQLPPILSVSETAKFMRVANKTILAAINTGQLQAVQLGRIYRIPREALIRWMNGLS